MHEKLSVYLTVNPIRVRRLDPRLRTMLEQHQCTIEENRSSVEEQESECVLTYTIIYPQGTTRQELYPRTFDARFRVMLPDGFEIREVNAHDGSFSVYAVIE